MGRTIKDKVEYVLDKYPATRDNDKLLVEVFWKTWDRPHISQNDAGDWVHLNNIIYMTSPDSITRCKRKFQEDGKYPAAKRVAEERRDREEMVRTTIRTEHFDTYLPN